MLYFSKSQVEKVNTSLVGCASGGGYHFIFLHRQSVRIVQSYKKGPPKLRKQCSYIYLGTEVESIRHGRISKLVYNLMLWFD